MLYDYWHDEMTGEDHNKAWLVNRSTDTVIKKNKKNKKARKENTEKLLPSLMLNGDIKR